MNVHDLRKFADRAYDVTQSQEGIEDGDVLILSDGMMGIMVKAWPCYLEEYDDAYHGFHRPDKPWSTFESGRYQESANLAVQIEQLLMEK